MHYTHIIFVGHHPPIPPSYHHHGYITSIPTVSPIFSLRKKVKQIQFTAGLQRLFSIHGGNQAYEFSDSLNSSTEHEGSGEKNDNFQGERPSSNKIVEKLRRYGVSGILSYGLLNTAYYLSALLFVWFYVAPAPGKMGYWAAVERFLKMMAMVWAGSQVTKLARAGGALALAPFVDRGLSLFMAKFKFKSQGKAFMAIVGFCFGLAIALFIVVTLLSA